MTVFVVTRGSHRLELLFSATLEHVDRAAEEARALVGALVEGRGLFETTLILREALTNAVLHGCGRDFLKTVLCSIEVLDRDLIIAVQDQGDGFDWRAVIEREAIPHIQSERGRGVAIMREYAEKLVYDEKGNRLTLTKRYR